MKKRRDEMTLDEYRADLRETYGTGEKLKSSLCDEIMFMLKTAQMAMTIRDIWEAFEQAIQIQDIRMALTWLILVGRIAINPKNKGSRKYWVDQNYLAEKKKQVEQKETKTSARDSILSLDPTVINEDVVTVLDEEIARLSAVKLASNINLSNENDLMISIQDKHVVVILTPQKKPYQSIKEFLIRLDTMAQLNRGLFYDLDTETDHGE